CPTSPSTPATKPPPARRAPAKTCARAAAAPGGSTRASARPAKGRARWWKGSAAP
ncbi:MAG: Chaperone protein DnaJ, partial [uncultured Sphingomonadaceae bacterium]